LCVFTRVQADPYVQVKLGTTKIDTSDEYVPNSLNPVFGKSVIVDCFVQMALAFLRSNSNAQMVLACFLTATQFQQQDTGIKTLSESNENDKVIGDFSEM